MKALICTPYAEPERGACTIRVNFFRNALEKKGIDVSVLAMARKGIPGKSGVKRFSSNFDLFRRVLEEKPSLVISVSPPLFPNVFSLFASKLCGARFVLDAKDDPSFYRKEFPSFAKKMKHFLFLLARRLVYIFSDGLMFLTQSDLREAVQSYKIPKERLFLVMNGTDTKSLLRDETQRKAVRKKLGFKSDEPAVFYAGSLGDEDVLGFLGASAPVIKESRAKLLLLIMHDSTKYGEAEYRGLLEKVSALGLSEKTAVETNVPYNEVYKFFSASDIGVVPWSDSLKTSIPVKLFDYSSAGLAIIAKAPKDSEIRDFFEKHSSGEFCSTWGAFSKRLAAMVSNPKELEKTGLRNRKTAEKFFDRSLQEKNFLDAAKI